jgi:hypothetical protein
MKPRRGKRARLRPAPCSYVIIRLRIDNRSQHAKSEKGREIIPSRRNCRERKSAEKRKWQKRRGAEEKSRRERAARGRASLSLSLSLVLLLLGGGGGGGGRRRALLPTAHLHDFSYLQETWSRPALEEMNKNRKIEESTV